MKNRIIFLDIDGVLNSVAYDRVRTAEQTNIDQTRLPLLKGLVDDTQAILILSSSWRKHWSPDEAQCDRIGRELNRIFAGHGMVISGKTPQRPDGDRAGEISDWLACHGGIASVSFVILDDAPFGWGVLQDHLVRTDARIGRGLEDRHIRKAVEILCRDS